jgi:hypothetical protein
MTPAKAAGATRSVAPTVGAMAKWLGFMVFVLGRDDLTASRLFTTWSPI